MMTQANETPAIDSVRINVTNDSAAADRLRAGRRQRPGRRPGGPQCTGRRRAKQQEAADQKPDVEKNGVTDTGKGGGAPAPVPAPAADPAPASEP